MVEKAANIREFKVCNGVRNEIRFGGKIRKRTQVSELLFWL